MCVWCRMRCVYCCCVGVCSIGGQCVGVGGGVGGCRCDSIGVRGEMVGLWVWCCVGRVGEGCVDIVGRDGDVEHERVREGVGGTKGRRQSVQ